MRVHRISQERSTMTEGLKWHLRVNGEPACSSRTLLDDRRIPLAAGFCSSFSRERIEGLAAEVRRFHPQLHVEVTQDGCHEGIF
jgi:hypothetical protein